MSWREHKLVASAARLWRVGIGGAATAGGHAVRLWRGMTPPLLLMVSFALLIATGTAGLLWIPALHVGPDLGFIDALFTATSAVCVTGLIVVDTATYFTFWGQLWLLILFQLGGIGLLTLTTAVIGALGGRLSLRSELADLPGKRRGEAVPIWRTTAEVARFTLIVEAVGALVLFLLWLPRFSAGDAAWHAVFQAVSAFCNAGFSTFSDSLERFNESSASLLVVSALIVLGGIGFLVIREVWGFWRRSRGERLHRLRLSTHTFAALVTTAALLVFGMVFFAWFEWRGVLSALGLCDRLANAWFMSVTSRTAGFNAVPTGALSNGGGFLVILLMFVGGSPGSTAGGLKTTTFALLVALGWARIRGRRHVEIRGRGIPEETIERAVGLTIIAFALLTVAFFLLNIFMRPFETEAEARAAFLPMAFETVSGFSTVGLSMGTTGELTGGGKLVITALMFIGRVGLFSFFSAIVLRRRRPAPYRPANEDVVVG